MEMEANRETPLPEREYAHVQIIGLRVITTQGELIGTISDIITGQSNDNYIVRGDKGEILIPAIEDVVQSINLDEGHVTIEAIDGLLDLNKKKPPEYSGGFVISHSYTETYGSFHLFHIVILYPPMVSLIGLITLYHLSNPTALSFCWQYTKKEEDYTCTQQFKSQSMK